MTVGQVSLGKNPGIFPWLQTAAGHVTHIEWAFTLAHVYSVDDFLIHLSLSSKLILYLGNHEWLS